MGVVCVVAAVLASHGWDRLQGRLNYLIVQDMKSDWHDRSRVPHDDELNEGFKLGYRALEREPASADYRFMLASMHAWREKSLRLWPDQAAAEADKVIENLKAALARRPSWFQAWSLLALVKFQVGEIDQQFVAALEKSMETGPYETSVHHGLAFVGPRAGIRLGATLEGQIVEVLRIALNNPNVDRFVVEQIVMAGMEGTFEDQLASDDRLTRLRDQFLKKRNEAL